MLSQLKIIGYFCAFIIASLSFSCAAFPATPSFLPTTAASFASVADIHFNPFYSCNKNKVCPLINKLVAAPTVEWPKILGQYDTQAPRYKEDTNYVLLKSTLQQLKKTDREQHAQFVLVLGDFLGHDYQKNYQYYTGDTSEKKDYLTYYYPLNEGKWKLEYDFNQAYQADCKVCTLAHGLKRLRKNIQHLNEYKRFFAVDRELPILSNLIYPALVCDLQAPNDIEYKKC